MRHGIIFLLTAFFIAPSLADTAVIDEIIIQASPIHDSAQQQLKQTPGNTHFIDQQSIQASSTGNLSDLLRFTPGLFAQQTNGPETRLSSRGSGLSIPWAVKGIKILRNGIVLNEADGWYHSQLVEPLTAEYSEFYPGANGMIYGAATLGGAINYQTYTGYSAPKASVSLEAGSHAYWHPQVSAAQAFDNGWDYYTSLSGLYSNGQRQRSKTDNTQFYGNLGYRQGRQETRLHLDLIDSEQQLPSNLTQWQVQHQPNYGFNPIKVGSFAGTEAGSENHFHKARLELTHRIQYRDKDSIVLAGFFDGQTVHHPLPYNVLQERLKNYGVQIYGNNFLQRHQLHWGASLLKGQTQARQYEPIGYGHKGDLWKKQANQALSFSAFIEERYALSQRWSAIAGLQWVYAKRQLNTDNLQTASHSQPSQTYSQFNPRFGLTWQVHDKVQLFGNLSRSFEVPVLNEFDSAYSASQQTLKAQSADTLELGTKVHSQHWQMQFALYRSYINNEILSTQDSSQFSGYRVDNVKKTIHQGIEFSANASVPVSASADLQIKLAYTFNDFYFRHDSSFANHQLPSIPRHFLQSAWFYQHANGFYIGPTLSIASAYYIDYANTYQAKSYTLWGAQSGYRADNWQVFIKLHNLGNVAYASSTQVVNDAQGQDSDAFLPGDRRSAIIGVRWRFE